MRRQAASLILMVAGFLVAVAIVPGIIDFAIAPRWAVLFAAVPLALLTVEIETISAHWVGGLFLGWCALSMLWTPVAYDGADGLLKILIMGGIFCLGAAVRDLRPVYTAMAIGISISGFLAMGQLLGWQPVDHVNSPAGLFGNKNSLAEIGALCLVPMVLERRWLLGPGVGLATVLPLSRGALAALGAALVVRLWSRSRLAAIALCLIAAVSAEVIVQRDHGECAAVPNTVVCGIGYSGNERLNIWIDTVRGLTVFGHGIGSFYQDYPTIAQRTDGEFSRLDQAHNELLHFAFELGIGLLPLLALIVLALRSALETERLILVTLLVECLFAFPLHLPATAFLGALVAGRLCADRIVVRLNVPDRRVLFRMGMA